MPPPEPDILAQGSTLSAALFVVWDVTRAMPLSEDQQMIYTYECVVQAGGMARIIVRAPPPHSGNVHRHGLHNEERVLDHRIVRLEYVDLLAPCF